MDGSRGDAKLLPRAPSVCVSFVVADRDVFFFSPSIPVTVSFALAATRSLHPSVGGSGGGHVHAHAAQMQGRGREGTTPHVLHSTRPAKQTGRRPSGFYPPASRSTSQRSVTWRSAKASLGGGGGAFCSASNDGSCTTFARRAPQAPGRSARGARRIETRHCRGRAEREASGADLGGRGRRARSREGSVGRFGRARAWTHENHWSRTRPSAFWRPKPTLWSASRTESRTDVSRTPASTALTTAASTSATRA